MTTATKYNDEFRRSVLTVSMRMAFERLIDRSVRAWLSDPHGNPDGNIEIAHRYRDRIQAELNAFRRN